jgi:hypothetical protein
LSSGNLIKVSQNITHSYQQNSAKAEMLAISPFRIVCGT